MLDAYLFFYQMIALLYNLLIPFAMLLGVLWMMAKMLKGFIRSLTK